MQNINRQSTYNYAAQLQEYICSALSASEWLQSLSVSFYPENSKDIEYQIKNALSRQGLACVVMTPRFSYIGHNESNCAWDARDVTLNIAEFVPVNRASNKVSCVTGLDIANYVVEYLGGPQGAVSFGKFCPKGIEQREDGKLLVTNITFDCSTIGDLSGVFDWDEEQHGVVISPYALESDLNELSVNVLDLSAIVADISSHSELSNYYTKSETSSAVELSSALSNKADISAIPTNVSQLSNDRGYITSAEVKPAQSGLYQGFALNSVGTLWMYRRDPYTNLIDYNTFLTLQSTESSAIPVLANTTYDSWSLSAYNGTTFSTPIELEWLGYVLKYTVIIRGRLRLIAVGAHIWKGSDGNGEYIVKAEPDAYGTMIPTDFGTRSGTATTITWHTATYNEEKTSILTIDGQADSISCSRPNTSQVVSHTEYLAYQSEVSSKADLSALEVKADLSALNNYLPLSGGHLNGQLSIDTTYSNGLTLVNAIDNANVTFAPVWESPERGNVLQVAVENGMGTTHYLYFPSKTGTLALKSDIDSAVSSKASISALSNYVPLSGGAIIQNDSPEGTTLIVQSNNSNGYSWLETKLSSDIGLAMYADNSTRAIYVDRTYEQRFLNKNGVIALTSDIDAAVSAKADKSALSNYVPLSGNATISGDIAIDADKFSITTPSCCLSVDGKKLVMWQTNLSSGQIDSSVISCAGEVYGRIGHFRGLGGLELLQIQSAPYEEGQSETADVLQCQTPWGSDAFTVKVEYDPANFERILPRLKSYDGAYWHGFTLSSETMEMDVSTAEGSGKLKFPAKNGTLATTSDITQSLSSYLPLSGGSIPNNLNLSGGDIIVTDSTGYTSLFYIARRTGGDASFILYYGEYPESSSDLYTNITIPSGRTGTFALKEDLNRKLVTVIPTMMSAGQYYCEINSANTTFVDCTDLPSSPFSIRLLIPVNNDIEEDFNVIIYNPNGANVSFDFNNFAWHSILSENGSSLNPGTAEYSLLELRSMWYDIHNNQMKYFGKLTPMSYAY